TYALLDERERVTLKGSAFRSRGLEPFQRRLIDALVRVLLLGQRSDAKAVVDRWLGEFAAHRVPVRDFARTETLQESLEVYRERVSAGLRPASAAYELAATSARPVQPGDQISYYVAGRTARVAVTDVAKLATLWDPPRPPRCGCGRASSTTRLRSRKSRPLSISTAFVASSFVAISTKPKPRGRPVNWSVMIRTVATVPACANSSHRSSSVAWKDRLPTNNFAAISRTSCPR